MAEGQTDYEKGFQAAFEMLNQSSTNKLNCVTIVIFWTDGGINHGVGGTSLINLIQKWNQDE